MDIKPIKLIDIASHLSDFLVRHNAEDSEVVVDAFLPIDKCVPGCLTLCLPQKLHMLEHSKAAAVIVPEGMPLPSLTASVIVVKKPLQAMNHLLQVLGADNCVAPGVHPTAVVAETAVVPESCTLGPHCVVEDHAVLGEGVCLESGAYVKQYARVGDRSRIGAYAVIERRAVMGERCDIGAHSVIGAIGFGYIPAEAGASDRMLHAGSVVLGKAVEVGTHVSICRGVLGDTVLGDHCKLDNFVHIAHNVEIGQSAFIAAGAAIAGSTKIGSGLRMGGHAGINGHLNITDGVMIAGATNIRKSISKPGKYIGVYPASSTRDWVARVAKLGKTKSDV